MTPDPTDTADNVPIDPRLANLKKGKPFVKGYDPRRNMKAVPKETTLIREKMRKLAAEIIGEGTEAEQTRFEAMLRMMFTSRNPAHNKLALQVLDPKILTEQVDVTSGGDSTPLAVSIPAELIAPDFLISHRAIISGSYTEFVEYGGRGSTKSSFTSLEFINLLVNNPNIHGLATRQVGNTMRDSVYSQLVWAVNELGVSDKFKCTTSPLEMEYLPTRQIIYFRGADDPMKIKSIKPKFGYIGLLWFEELDAFRGANAVRNIEQSAIRGGDVAYIFKTFNPPPTSNNWANKYILIPKASQWRHTSDYRSVPIEWLGRVFLDEAEHLKNVNPSAYEHEYLGKPSNDGGMVFTNVKLEAITDKQIKQFDNILSGLDYGFYPDPASFGQMYYDAARRTLYIFNEARYFKKGNEALYDALKDEHGLKDADLLIADSAEPKSIADFRAYGSNCRGAEKGKESRKYSYKWLQGLTAIIIDPVRAPYHADEFTSCEYERTKDGEIISEYPQVNDHAIDDVRYGCNLLWKQSGL